MNFIKSLTLSRKRTCRPYITKVHKDKSLHNNDLIMMNTINTNEISNICELCRSASKICTNFAVIKTTLKTSTSE